ncbi:MAG: DUF488 domain-containing protein [Xanthomonadales bacterium]|nr:DUF488 domain-containing protein [Xanthomonadales bacterium]
MARPRNNEDAPVTVWTVGHSSHAWEDFLALLDHHGIEAIADVRRYPGSRRHPWFASETMARALPEVAIDYLWLPQLGGRRQAQPGSPNGGWRNAAFQGYADHLASAEFAEGLTQALALARRRRTALMCAESVWWRCHRRLIADLLQHRGHTVLHILGDRPAQAHPGNPVAQARGADLIYPPVQAPLFPD